MAPLFTLAEVELAVGVVRASVPPTPQYRWPQLEVRTGVEVFVKHENHTPTGAFKVRGGLLWIERLRRAQPQVTGIVSATRGNHGQSLAFAARRAGVAASLVVPHGNSVEKNAAMRALGADLVEHGRDFDDAREHAQRLANAMGYVLAPSFHRDLVIGVATGALELLTAVPDLDTVYVPVGLGSGICAMIGVRDALGLATEVVGVVAARANGYARSFAAGAVIATDAADTFADGLAVRVPDPDALAIIAAGAARIVEVSEADIAEAIAVYFMDIHATAEGAGAAALAALLNERDRMRGRRVGVVLSGQNIDRAVMAEVLAGRVPGRGQGEGRTDDARHW